MAPQNVCIHYDCTWGFTVSWLVRNDSGFLTADEYRVEYVTDDARSTAVPTLHTQKGIKSAETNISRKDFCESFVVYFVQVQAVNLEFNSSSVFSTVSLVRRHRGKQVKKFKPIPCVCVLEQVYRYSRQYKF